MPVVVAARTRHKDASNRRKEAAKKRQSDEQEGFDALSEEDQTFIKGMFAEYDTDQSGSLDKDELRKLMTKLNDGIIPGDDEVDAVLETADKDNSGNIGVLEVQKVLTVWFYSVEEKKKSSACVLL